MAAGSTYAPIATTTLGSATASYTFSSIPSTYTDLILIYQTRASSQNVYIDVVGQINGDTGSNYQYMYLSGSGSAAQSGRTATDTRMVFDANGAPWNSYWAIGQVNFMDYANTTTYKTVISRAGNSGGTSGGTDLVANIWRNTSAINSIKVQLYNSPTYSLDAGSTFTLYGITAA
jgi:hypothetical protein